MISRANAYKAARPCYRERMDRAVLLKHLQQARAHIAEGERHIRRQREIIDELERDGHNAELARELLVTLERVQETHISAGDRLVKMLEELG
jgi:chromosome condensin MukBEF ATPase and DNA-binding subunit MukB